MNLRSSIITAFRYEVTSLSKSIFNLSKRGLVVSICVAAYQILSFQTTVAVGLMVLSSFFIRELARAGWSDRKTWIVTFAGIVLLGIVAVLWLPRWSGYIVTFAVVPLVFLPAVLLGIATRGVDVGNARAAWPGRRRRHRWEEALRVEHDRLLLACG
jgi:hypothetical protein